MLAICPTCRPALDARKPTFSATVRSSSFLHSASFAVTVGNCSVSPRSFSHSLCKVVTSLAVPIQWRAVTLVSTFMHLLFRRFEPPFCRHSSLPFNIADAPQILTLFIELSCSTFKCRFIMPDYIPGSYLYAFIGLSVLVRAAGFHVITVSTNSESPQRTIRFVSYFAISQHTSHTLTSRAGTHKSLQS